jgi:hypothetical protein
MPKHNEIEGLKLKSLITYIIKPRFDEVHTKKQINTQDLTNLHEAIRIKYLIPLLKNELSSAMYPNFIKYILAKYDSTNTFQTDVNKFNDKLKEKLENARKKLFGENNEKIGELTEELSIIAYDSITNKNDYDNWLKSQQSPEIDKNEEQTFDDFIISVSSNSEFMHDSSTSEDITARVKHILNYNSSHHITNIYNLHDIIKYTLKINIICDFTEDKINYEDAIKELESVDNKQNSNSILLKNIESLEKTIYNFRDGCDHHYVSQILESALLQILQTSVERNLMLENCEILFQIFVNQGFIANLQQYENLSLRTIDLWYEILCKNEKLETHLSDNYQSIILPALKNIVLLHEIKQQEIKNFDNLCNELFDNRDNNNTDSEYQNTIEILKIILGKSKFKKVEWGGRIFPSKQALKNAVMQEQEKFKKIIIQYQDHQLSDKCSTSTKSVKFADEIEKIPNKDLQDIPYPQHKTDYESSDNHLHTLVNNQDEKFLLAQSGPF